MNDGRAIPQLGFGVWQVPKDGAASAVRTAIEAGYRLIDTAAIYANERGVGEGMRAAGAPRDQIFLTTKVWNDAQGFESTLKACSDSLNRLKADALDLYLIHWPSPHRNLFVDTWRALIRLREDGRAKSIGVSNFRIEDLERIIGETGVVPALNQIELHPYLPQKALSAFHAKHDILTQAWSPLGQGKLLDDPALAPIAKKHRRTPAQIVLRWHLQKGVVAIPKSVTPARIAENFAVFDFTLDETDLAAIDALETPSGRIGPDPNTASF
jgi:2,5-diketo-D-gluconate reductase A